MVTPHILAHQILQPNESRLLEQLALPAGGYRVRTQRPGVEQILELDEDTQNRLTSLSIQAGSEAIQAAFQRDYFSDKRNNSALSVTLTNTAPYAQEIYIERADWYTDAVTAAQVTTLQHFRDLFSDAVLRPGEEIGVQGMTIMFSDLVGSTAMYNRWGDAPSYALVREQFAFLQRIVRERNGAIVKTIGDAIMAAFAEPADGVAAALAIQQKVDDFNASSPDNLIIKLGLHYGPCIAVTLNGRLDYFGTTVNLAARLEGQSKGGDVVISERLGNDPAVKELLASLPVEATRFETAIKGFDEHFCLYRLTLAKVKPVNSYQSYVVDKV
jgi:class 3 adenylate cyclase